MEIRFYNNQFQLLGVSENQTSVIWNRKYNECGNFEIHTPINEWNTMMYQIDVLVWIKGEKEIGIIEDVKFIQNAKNAEIVAKGRFFESWWEKRIIKNRPKTFNGKVEELMYNIISDINITEPLGVQKIKKCPLKGFEETLNMEITWKPALAVLSKMAKSANLGFRVYPDFSSNNPSQRYLYFEVYKGVDHTREQFENPHVEFSEEFNNLTDCTVTGNNQLERNLCYVLGEGEGYSRVSVMLYDGDTEPTYLNRREMIVDARDLQKGDLTDDEYRALLTQRGREKLAESKMNFSIESKINALGNFVYKRDFDLGDIVTVKKNSWGLTTNARITEVMEIYEHGIMEVELTLGNPLPTKLNMEEW